MALSLDQLKQAFAKQEAKTDNSGYWNRFFPFWKIKDDEQALVRFLPDQDQDNPMGFVVENLSHKLTVNGKERTVGCLKMYGESCPCCERSRKYYDEKDEKMGLKFWRRQEFIGQVLIVNSPIEVPAIEGDNPVRLIMLGPKIFKLIQASFASGDLEANPTDFIEGYDFRISKSKQGEYSNYDLSRFVPKQSAISNDLLESMTLNNLADYRTRKTERDAMEAMIEADLNGKSYEEGSKEGSNVASKVSTPLKTGVDSETLVQAIAGETKAEDSKSSTTVKSTDDILAKIRNRVAAKKSEA